MGGEVHLEKGLICEDQYQKAMSESYSRYNAPDFIRQERDMFRQAEDRAKRAKNDDCLGRTLGCMAFSLHNRDPRDDAKAEEIAREAVRLGESWGNAQKVLDEIQQVRDEKNQRVYNDALQKKGAGNEIPALEEAISVFQTIAGWRDVDEQIRLCRERIEELRRQAEAEKAAQEEAARRKKKRRRVTLAVTAAVVVLAVAVTLPVLHIRRHRAGDCVSWKLEDGVLTFAGTGAIQNPQTWNRSWEDKQSVQTAVVGEGITLLDYNLFSDCNNLTGVSLPDGLAVIRDSVFAYCGSLTEIELPASLRRIGNGAFSSSGLETVIFRGTREQWDQIECCEEQYDGTLSSPFGENDVIIRCTDGEFRYEIGEEAAS